MLTQDFRIQSPDAGFTIIRKTRALTNPERHFHSSHELLYIISGERTFFHANRTFFIQAGDFVCIRPGVLHRALNKNNQVCDLVNIYFDDPGSPFVAAMLPLLESLVPAEKPVLSIRGNDRPAMEKILFDVARELEEKKSGYILQAWGLLIQFLVALSRYQGDDPRTRVDPPMNPRISAMLEWLSASFREPVTLARAARKFNMSETYLSRLFRSATHFSFIEYLNSLRIQEACVLLSGSRKRVTDISAECGFGSVTQFGRCFRSVTGESPLAYRKRTVKS